MAPSLGSSSGAAQLRRVNPRPILLTCALLLIRSMEIAGARQSSSDASSSSASGASTRSMSARELARMIIERDEKEISVLKSRRESLYDEYCPRGADGVRRPTDRVLQFIVPPTSQQEERRPVALGDEVTLQGALASPGQERAAPFKEKKLILEAYRSQRRRIAADTVFRSKRTQELERLKTTVVYPYMLIRVRMPDGASLQARFHPDERASAVVDCVQGAMDKRVLEAGGFELLSLGSAKRMVLSSAGNRTQGSLASTLQECGLTPPAATLMFKWKKGRPQPSRAAASAGTTTMMEESKQAEAAREPVKQTVSTPLIDPESSLHGKVKHITWLEKIRRFEALPLRLIGLCTGIAVIVIAIMTLSAKLLNLNVLGAINQAWIIIFGLLLVGLEIRGWNNFISRHASRWLDYNVHILTTLYGRGVLYIFLGTLELGFWSSLLHLILGIVLCAMGVIIIAVGIALSVKLRSLRKELSKQDVSRQVFRQYDVNGDGRLSTTELAALCQALGSKLSHAELEAAVLLLDRNRDGFVDEEEFVSFWRGKSATNVLSSV